MSAPSDYVRDSNRLIRSAFEHATKVMPDLDEQSFLNGFLFGMRFAAMLLREFMGEAY